MRLIKSLLVAFLFSACAFAQSGGFLLQFQQGGTNVAGATYKKYALVNFQSGCSAAVSGGALNISCTGVAGNPGGSAGQLQFNSAGTAFAGITQWTTNGTTTITGGTTGVLNLGSLTTANLVFPTAFSTGFLRVTTATGALSSGELSGDCTTSGSLSITCTKTSGTAFSGLATASIPLSVANGGTATSSTLVGVVRGGNPFTASEMSGDCTTAGSNSLTCTKTNGTAFSGLATASIPVSIANGGTGTSSTLTGLVRGSGTAMTAAELSGDVLTSGSNTVTVKGINGTLLASLATGILENTTATGVPSIAGPADVDALYTGSGKCYLFKGTSPGTNDGCDNPAGSGTVNTSGSPASGNLAAFSGPSTITNTNLTGDVTTANTSATTVSAIDGVTVSISGAAAGQSLTITSGPTITNAFPGVPIDTESGATYTVRGDGAGSDRVSVILTTNNTTSTAVTVPQAGSTGFDHFYTFGAINSGSVVATYTPTTSTINGNTTMKLVGQVTGHNPEGALWYSNANGATGQYVGFEILPTDANGLLAAEGFPGLTGDVTASSGSFATTVVKVNGASVPISATVLGSNSSGQLVAASLQGNGAKAQLSTGTTTTNDCVKFDANGNTVDSGGACAGGTPTFPITISGGVSGGIPYFSSTTVESASALLAAHVIMQGGGAGTAPTTGNGDFTIDSTAHTLIAGAAGLVDFSGMTGANAFKIPSVAACTSNGTSSLCYDTTGKLLHIPINAADATAVGETGTSTITTQVLHATATAGIGTFSAIATGDLPVIPIAGGGTNATSAAAGQVPNSTTTTASSWTSTPTLGASGTLGTLTFGNDTSGTLKITPVTGVGLGTIVITAPAFTGTMVVAATSTTTTQALFATSTAGAPSYRGITAGDLPSSVVFNNSTNTGTSAMTLDMHASTTANALQVPSLAGLTSNGTSSIGYDSTNKNFHIPSNAVDSIAAAIPASATLTNNDCVKFTVTGSTWTLADAGAACGSGGGGGASAAFTVLAKTASYATVSGDFSASTTAPTIVDYTCTTTHTTCTHTLPSATTGLTSGGYQIVKNDCAGTQGVIIQPATLTLDGSATVPIYLEPCAEARITFNGSNFISSIGQVAQSNIGGFLTPLNFQSNGSISSIAVSNVNIPEIYIFTLQSATLVTNITINVGATATASVCDFGIYDTGGNRVFHTGTQFDCHTATGAQKQAASTATVLAPGTYVQAWCASVAATGVIGAGEPSSVDAINSASGSKVGIGQGGATAGTPSAVCTTGVLPTSMAYTINSNPSGVPVAALTP